MGWPKGRPKAEGSGRKKGTPNIASAARAAECASGGITPLDYLLTVMRDKTRLVSERLDAAKAAAPYIHPRLNSVEVAGKPGAPIETKDITDEDRAIALAAFLAKTKAFADQRGN